MLVHPEVLGLDAERQAEHLREVQHRQPEAAKFVERDLDIPILHLPQMLGLALGIEPKELGMNKHVVSTKEVQKKVATLAAA